MKKLLTTSFIALSLVCSGIHPAAAGAQKTVYMTVWRGCEEACEAFKKYFAAEGLDAKIIVKDAKRDKKVLPEFIKEARDLKADLVVTWHCDGMSTCVTE